MATPLDFAKALLNRLGLAQTQNRLVSLVAFAGIEGGHWHDSAKRNPYNTMFSVPGATQAPGLLSGIKSYPDWSSGIEATARTMTQNNMASIMAALKADVDPKSFLHAITQSAWCPGCNYDPFNPTALYNAHANEQDGGEGIAQGISSLSTPAKIAIAAALVGAAFVTASYIQTGRFPRIPLLNA